MCSGGNEEKEERSAESATQVAQCAKERIQKEAGEAILFKTSRQRRKIQTRKIYDEKEW